MIGIQATSIHGMYHQQCEWCCCVGEMDGGERERDSQLGCFCTGCQLPLQDTISFTLALPVFPHRMYSRTCEGFADPGWNSSNSSHESQVNSSHGDWFQPPH